MVVGVLQLLCQHRGGTLTLFETFAMSLPRGLGHLGQCRLECLGLLGDPLLRRRQRLIEFGARALLMPVRADHPLAAIVAIERTMVNHPLKALFLQLVTRAVHPGPRGGFQDRLDLWRCPVHQGFARRGLDQDKTSGIIRPGDFPRPALDPRAIRQGVDLCSFKAVQALMLIVVEHAEQAQALLVERTGHGHGIDRPVNDKKDAPGCCTSLLAVGDNDLRQMDVGRIIRDKEGLARVIMGDDGLRAGHDTPQHGDFALMHGHPAPIGDHVPIDIGHLACFGR